MGDLFFGKEEKKMPESSLSAIWGQHWQGAIRKPGSEPHKKLVKHQLVPWFWTSHSPEWWEINFCVCSHPICSILLQQLEQIGTIHTEFLQRISKQSRDNRRAEHRITRHARASKDCTPSSESVMSMEGIRTRPWKWRALHCHNCTTAQSLLQNAQQTTHNYLRRWAVLLMALRKKKNFAFQGLFKDSLYHNRSFSYSRKALTATQGLCEDKVIRWLAELRSKLRADHSLPRILLIKHPHRIK